MGSQLIRKKSSWCCGLMLMAVVSMGFAASTSSAARFITKTATRFIKVLDTRQGQWQDYPQQLEAVVKRIILPHVDVKVMAQQTVGRAAWMAATPAVQKKFVRAFQTMVIRTYSTAFVEYNGETIRVLPVRVPVQSAQVVINTEIHLLNGQTIAVDYRLYWQGRRWLIVDFDVEGVSLVQNYRAQFADTLEQQGGLAGLTRTLIQHNRKTAP